MHKLPTQSDGGQNRTLCALPNDILGKIIHELSFQDKCALELFSRQFHILLSNPVAGEGMWGSCDLMSDLKLEENFDKREDVMRWLVNRLPGFTHLRCKTYRGNKSCLETYAYRSCNTFKATEAATWLVAQLPALVKRKTSMLHLEISADISSELLMAAAGKDTQRIQHERWAATWNTLVELSFILEAAEEPMRLAGLAQLTALTSLTIHRPAYLWQDLAVITPFDEEYVSYLIDIPGLKTLRFVDLEVTRLTLLCPQLHSLAFQKWFKGRLPLQAPLADLSFCVFASLRLQTAFSHNTLLGLTRLQWHLDGKIVQDDVYCILPEMSNLRMLQLVIAFDKGGLPSLLPAKLQGISYTKLGIVWHRQDFHNFEVASQVPELQSITLSTRALMWDDHDDHLSIRAIEKRALGKVILDFVSETELMPDIPQ